MKGLSAPRVDLAFRAAAFRIALDNLLQEHGAVMRIGWQGKWAKLHVEFPEVATNEGVTLITCAKNGKVRYVTEQEEL